MMEHLKELISMGFAPMMAAVIVVVIVLWLALCSLVLFVWRQFNKDRKDRDDLRKEQLDEINGRLDASETKHEECDQDRNRLHQEMNKISNRLGRFEGCPRKGCPMRLP